MLIYDLFFYNLDIYSTKQNMFEWLGVLMPDDGCLSIFSTGAYKNFNTNNSSIWVQNGQNEKTMYEYLTTLYQYS